MENDQKPSIDLLVPQSEPVVVTPPPENIPEPSENPEGSRLPLILGIFLVLFLILATIGGAVVGIAYGKVKIHNSTIESSLSDFVQGLPFTPKTPKYLITHAILAQKKVSKHSLDLSVALDFSNVVQALGLNHIDAGVKGSVDYSDPKNPRVSLNTSITKDFNADIIKNDTILYFKINKILPLLLAFYGITDQEAVNKILENWVAVDTKPLQTQAREELDKNNTSTSLTNQTIQKTLDTYLDDQILAATSISQVKEDGFNVYKLTLQTTPALIDHIGDVAEKQSGGKVAGSSKTKASDTVKDLKLSLSIDKSSYYVRKGAISFKLITPDYSSLYTIGSSGLTGASTSTTSIAAVLALSDFGKDFKVETPETSVKPEEYFQMLMGLSSNLGINPVENLAKSRDSARLSTVSQLGHALEAYMAVKNGSYVDLSLPCANSDTKKYDRWMNCLVPDELANAPSELKYEISGVSKCNTNTSQALSTKYSEQNGFCYKSGVGGAGPIVIFSRLESETFVNKCPNPGAGKSRWAWAAYSSLEGRGGQVCTQVATNGNVVEPTVGKQNFIQ